MVAVMKLSDYLSKRGSTLKAGCPVIATEAEKCGTSPRMMYMLALGHKLAGPKLAGAIERGTDGRVKRADLRPDYFGKVA